MSQAISFRRKDGNNISPNKNTNGEGASHGLSASALGLGISPKWRASPMSFKIGSLIGGTAPGCSPIPSLDDFKMAQGSLPSSYDHSRLLQALSSNTSDDGCSNYTCCGLPLNDLHALLDHFEESHVYVLDPAPNASTTTTTAHMMHDMEMDGSSNSPTLDSGTTSTTSTSSSETSSPQIGQLRPLLNTATTPTTASTNTTTSFGYTTTSNLSVQLAQQNQCIPPSLLFSPMASPTSSRPQSSAGIPPSITTGEQPSMPQTPSRSHSHSRSRSMTSTSLSSPVKKEKLQIVTAADAANIDESTVISGPGIVHPGPPPPTQAPTSFSKPFKCPTPSCNKSYKQANGLKYHLTHGQCCFLPKDPALEGLDEHEKDKVERPFGCGVGGCERRYKNMNGLRYHYQHSGAHGAVGLALLAAGTHSVQIAAHNAALGRASSKALQQTPKSPMSPSSMSSPRSPTSSSSHQRSMSVMSYASTVKSPKSPTSAVTAGRTYAATAAGYPPSSSTTATANYQYSMNMGPPGYPYLNNPAFPPLGAPFSYTSSTPTPSNPNPTGTSRPPMLRTNSLGTSGPIVGVSNIIAEGVKMEVEGAANEEDYEEEEEDDRMEE